MKTITSALVIMLTVSAISAQTLITPDDHLINGYAEKISGLDFEYHSCLPGVRQSILLRATSGKDYMEWKTDPAPATVKGNYATFIWVAALGSSPGKARMDLTVDGKETFLFHTDGRKEWKTEGSEGSILSFSTIMTDQHGDNHGYMMLRIPSAKSTPGARIIKVTGSKSDLTSWYMTFRKPVKTGITLNAFPAIIMKETGEMQLVEAGIFYFGEAADARIYANGKLLETAPLKFGYNNVNLGLQPVKKPTKVNLRVVAGDFSVTNTVMLQPVRKWTISFIQHSHTDIGYTRSQTEILAEHLRYIDYALDYCDATDNYPDEAKFRWTCEASWPVDEYLRSRPEAQAERLIRRIREGRIEVTGMYFNFDEIPDERMLAASLSAAGRISDRGIPLKVAMQNDVNGIGWCLNDYFSRMGIRYLNMGTHGHRALICFDVPTMFWWESPSGNRMLTFRAEHYMTGNTVLEMQTGNIARFRNNLLNYLNTLAAKGYPYDEMAIQHSGYLTDNSPPSTIACDLIKEWNNTFVWPKLSTSTTESFFTAMEENHASEFPVIRGAWPDWWTDGFGASARETAATRIASYSLAANTAGLAMAAASGMKMPDGIVSRIDLANNALLFYGEHTTGYSESVREPLGLPTMEQRAIKESYAWEANRRTASVGEETMGLLQSGFRREKEPSIIVFNTLNWDRSGLVNVYIDHQIIPRGKIAGVFDREGNRMPAQAVSHRSDGTEWAIWLKDIPSFGFRKYLLRPVDEQPEALTAQEQPVLENDWYRISADPSKGTITSWYDKDLSIELIDRESRYGLGEFILEKLGNRSQMESRKLDDFTRSALDTVWLGSIKKNEIWNSITFFGESETFEGPRGFMIEVRLFNTGKRMDIACSAIKKSIFTPESFYISFPLRLEGGKHYTEVQGGVIETGKDQIKGSSNDWYTMQNFTSVRNGASQVVIGSAAMPLFQAGSINTGRYTAGAMPQGTHLFSWPMNNYWVTNFNADQRGGHAWTYYLTSSNDNGPGFATRFGAGCRTPFLARIIPGAGDGDNKWEGRYIAGWPQNALLVSAVPEADGKSCVVHLRELEGRSVVPELSVGKTGKKLSMIEVDANGKQLSNPTNTIKPYEAKFFRINF
jgi:alpha-mannosidase